MANYDMNCPHCGTELEVQDEWTGMEMSCPSCQNAFTVPPRPEPVEATSQSAAYDVFCPNCGSTLEVQSDCAGMQMSCPVCQNAFTVPPEPAAAPAAPQLKLAKRSLTLRRTTPEPAPSMYAVPRMRPEPPVRVHRRPPEPEPPQSNSGKRLLGCGICFLVIALIGGAGWFMWRSINLSRLEKVHRISCSSNIKQLLRASKMYAGELGWRYRYFPTGSSQDYVPSFMNNDPAWTWMRTLPPSLKLLVSNGYNEDRNTFQCPSNPGKCSYLLVPGISENAPADLPLILELPSNHNDLDKEGSIYVNVGYVSGEVQMKLLPKDCRTCEKVAEHLLKEIPLSDFSQSDRERYMQNVREAERLLPQSL
ncbi:MAG: hypothetical protein J5806_11680 [Lentisphaeria bacterium]|nr:hypothetical protein [Lentisphaeria bacterium]